MSGPSSISLNMDIAERSRRSATRIWWIEPAVSRSLMQSWLAARWAKAPAAIRPKASAAVMPASSGGGLLLMAAGSRPGSRSGTSSRLTAKGTESDRAWSSAQSGAQGPADSLMSTKQKGSGPTSPWLTIISADQDPPASA